MKHFNDFEYKFINLSVNEILQINIDTKLFNSLRLHGENERTR